MVDAAQLQDLRLWIPGSAGQLVAPGVTA